MTEVVVVKAHEQNLNQDNMHVLSGCCCFNTLISLNCCEFLGCSGVSECLCIKEEFCCKPSHPCMPCILFCSEGFCCRLGMCCCNIGIKLPDHCCKSQSQFCCITTNASLPNDEDTPCIVAMCGLVCYPKCGCCTTFKYLFI